MFFVLLTVPEEETQKERNQNHKFVMFWSIQQVGNLPPNYSKSQRVGERGGEGTLNRLVV